MHARVIAGSATTSILTTQVVAQQVELQKVGVHVPCIRALCSWLHSGSGGAARVIALLQHARLSVVGRQCHSGDAPGSRL